jgi:hypothetical protein
MAVITKEYAGTVWAAVPDREGYFVSAQGKVLSTIGGCPHTLKQMCHRRGYQFVFLYGRGRKHRLKAYVHRLTLAAWEGADRPGLDCRHLDDDKRNNCLENLAWGDRLENMADAKRNGRIQFGEARPMHKLTETQALEVKAARRRGESYSSIARRYDVATSTARKIALGIKWAYLDNTKEGQP